MLAQRFWLVAGNGDLRRLWVGRTTSVIGDRMFAVGVIWIAWSLTHSSAGVACVILAESLPFLAWGALRQRVTVRVGVRTLAGLDLVRASLLIGLLFLSYDGVITKACGLALVTGIAFLTAIFEPAFRSLIPELVPGEGRQAYANFDLGARLARIAGPLLAAAITWAGSPRALIAADIATFLVSAFCLARTADPHIIQAPLQQPTSQVEHERLPALARSLIRANGLGTFALIVWWLALPIASAHHARGASTYGVCVGISAAGGILANLVLSRAPNRHQPITLCAAGWAVTAVCIGALVTNPDPLLLESVSLVCGAALACTALGFSFHAASLPLSQRNHLFQQDQIVMRAAGAAGAVLGGMALAYSPHAALVATAALLATFAGSIWRGRVTSQTGLMARAEVSAVDGPQG
jgi:predicted MFS family arabinose efflux permease